MSRDPADEIVDDLMKGYSPKQQVVFCYEDIEEFIRRAVAAGRELGLEEAERLKSAAILRWNATEPNREMFWQDRGAASERAAIVAYLKRGAREVLGAVSRGLRENSAASDALRYIAEDVEAGEHLKGAK